MEKEFRKLDFGRVMGNGMVAPFFDCPVARLFHVTMCIDWLLICAVEIFVLVLITNIFTNLWWHGVAVTTLGVSMKLLYVWSCSYWDGWPSSDGQTTSVCNQPL